MSQTFDRFGIEPDLVAALRKQGVVTPTPVQAKAIPVLMAGKDAIVQAQTGTGKTLAFALPIASRARASESHTQALIVTPTRELAIQIASVVRELAEVAGLGVLAAYGGQDVEAQMRKLQGSVHIVVGTPGRLLDHLRRGTLALDRLETLVLDEADQMLHMGFQTEVTEIIRQTPHSRQTTLCSATMPEGVRQLAARYMRSPEDIRVEGRQVTIELIRQRLVETTDRGRFRTLVGLIEREHPYLAVAFCRTKIRAKKLADSLRAEGIEVDELHGDLTQAKREQVMRRFREAKFQVLVATDVAARGLDVEGVTHVFNYDVPTDGESYIHRTGRTGRAGTAGMAITLASAKDMPDVRAIERTIGMPLERMTVDGEDAGERSAGRSDGRASRSGGGAGRGDSGERRNAGRRGAGRNDGASSRRGGEGRAAAGGRQPREAGRGGRGERSGGRAEGEAWSRAGGETKRGERRGAEGRAAAGRQPREAGYGGRGERSSGRGGDDARGGSRKGGEVRAASASRTSDAQRWPARDARGSRGGEAVAGGNRSAGVGAGRAVRPAGATGRTAGGPSRSGGGSGRPGNGRPSGRSSGGRPGGRSR